ncbi:protein FAM110A [Esox lucius]|uniref:Family with sequence similarity 110 member A n=1 Tax=Esox lucius TaxID=8010 RepID=A0A3P8Z4B3_ESOLU|nr:protein FAM110A [Esox lucius]
MPVETVRAVARRPAAARPAAAGTATSSSVHTPNRLRLQPRTAAPAEPRQSAVERLAADKAKYVKSQAALSRQQPVKVPPPVIRKPLMSPAATLAPTRKALTPRPNYTQLGSAPLDLEHLSNLINGETEAETPLASPSIPTGDQKGSNQAPDNPTTTTSSTCPTEGIPTLCPRSSTPVKVGLNALAKASPTGSPTAATIRRVDVIPQHTTATRTSLRAPLQMRLPLHSHTQIHQAKSPLRLFHPRTTYPPGPAPLKPVPAPPPQDRTPTSPARSFKFPADSPVLPPSPSITRLSSGSTRKRPSLTRSKSDMSDRYSRAGTDLERFFNLCGLDPSEMQALKGSHSDITSLAQFRSASAPGSECAGQVGEEEEKEGEVPYGVSVIERNARVIKWLYGIRESKESAKSTNV